MCEAYSESDAGHLGALNGKWGLRSSNSHASRHSARTCRTLYRHLASLRVTLLASTAPYESDSKKKRVLAAGERAERVARLPISKVGENGAKRKRTPWASLANSSFGMPHHPAGASVHRVRALMHVATWVARLACDARVYEGSGVALRSFNGLPEFVARQRPACT